MERCHHCLISISAALEAAGMSQPGADSIAEVFFQAEMALQAGRDVPGMGWCPRIPAPAWQCPQHPVLTDQGSPAHPAAPNTPGCVMGELGPGTELCVRAFRALHGAFWPALLSHSVLSWLPEACPGS